MTFSAYLQQHKLYVKWDGSSWQLLSSSGGFVWVRMSDVMSRICVHHSPRELCFLISGRELDSEGTWRDTPPINLIYDGPGQHG